MNLSMVILFCLLIIGGGVVLFTLFHFLKRQIAEQVKTSQEQFLQLAKQQYEAQQNKAAGELETRKQAVEFSVKGLKDELEKYQKLIHQFEQDRAQKYGSLENELKNASQATFNLQEATNRLNNILGNVKLRGQWGERMAEDIIRHAGLIDGINYKKQTQLETALTKPDYTFFLPNGHKINMDVKFPLDNYLKMVNGDTPDEKERYSKDFIRNVKDRVKEIQGRDYINPAENTLDFVLLFIPNEQVFALIQEKMPTIMDESLKEKVVLCSPFTLYAMLSVVRQAFENFRYEKDIKKIVLLVDQFLKIYTTFKVRFDDIGKSIEKLENIYGDVKDKSFKGLDTKIRHIEDYKKGKGIVASESDAIVVDAESELLEDDSRAM